MMIMVIIEMCMFMVVPLNHQFRLFETDQFCFCNCSPPGTFLPIDLRLKYGLNMLPSDSFISNLYSKLGYSSGESRALQLIVPVVFGVVD